MRQDLSTILPDLTGYCLAFDLDGTLVDTAPDLVGAVNHVLGEEGRPPIGPETLRALIGHGAKVLIERAFVATGEPVDPAALPRLIPSFMNYYRAHIADFSRPFPGTEAALVRLTDAGATLAVCTNKAEGLSTALLEALDLTRYFPVLVGGDTLPVHKPDAEHFLETVRRLGGDRARSLLVGDSPTDAATARNAGVPFVAVTFGYTPVPPEEFGAQALISHFDDLDAAIARVVAERN